MKQNYFKSITKKISITFSLLVLFCFQTYAQTLIKPVITNITTDTGISISDYITNDTSIEIDGTATPNSKIALKINGLSTAIFEVYVTTNSLGIFTFDLLSHGIVLEDGTTTLTAESSLNGESRESESKSITIDTQIPEITSIGLINTSEIQPSSINFLVNFNEIVNNITIDDFELTLTNSVGAYINSTTTSQGSNLVVNVVITNPTVDSGSIRLDLKANTDLIDVAGNGDGVSGYVSAFTSGNTYQLNAETLDNSSVELKKEISIYYNTFNSDLTITSEKVINHTAIYDITGKLIVSNTKKTINLSNLKTGMYIINVYSEGKVVNYKIII